MIKIKTCKNCPHYTGQIEHGWNEYWGECKKNKNTFFVFDDTPCLQNINTLREVYYQQKQKIVELEWQVEDEQIIKERIIVRGRTIEKYRQMLEIACKHIPKEKYKQYSKEQLEYLRNYEIKNIELTESKQD